jgi:hypothetical protein
VLRQGLHIEGKPLWSWLTTLKARRVLWATGLHEAILAFVWFQAKPATLVRSALAKYCSKDRVVGVEPGGQRY